MVRVETNESKISDIFKARYIVPDYQREYSWGQDVVRQFIEDLLYVKANKLTDYFFGPMVFIPSHSESKVIDGQQRLATLSTFVIVIRDILLENGKTVSSTFAQYLFDGSRVRTTLNEANREFYKDYLLEMPSGNVIAKIKKMKQVIDTSTKSDRNLLNAYEYIYDRLMKEWPDKTKTNWLTDLVTTLLNSFRVIIITAEHNEAHLIFETLNERGTRLTHSDLVKNYLIRIAGENEAEGVYNKWKKVMENVGDNSDGFLRHYCIANYGKTTKTDLYRIIKEKNSDKSSVLRFIKSLKTYSAIYKEIKNPTIGYWQNKEIMRCLNEILDISSTVFYPLLMLSKEKSGDKTKLFKLLNWCISLFVRYKTILNLHHTKLERLTIAACEMIRNGESITSPKIKQLFSDIYPSDGIFEENFRFHSQYDNKIARYLIVKVCKMYEYDTSPEENVTLEHVIPESMSKYRGDVVSDKPDNIKEWDRYMRKNNLSYSEIHRLGNMALLLPKDNEKIKDKSFGEKKRIYEQSSIPFTKNISKYKEWTTSVINERQIELAKKAKLTWKINS